ncbi:hypothetical protein E2C01_029407 [Portunus trituberculatus]|uniref:Uncharacterized protein n=1 Tax=Portunus trituberculatus TaxID=210409 RepID=A0A5B7ERS9_PORTR|nr:hypothetical protein [Portunus trituberculatus]
MYCGRGYYCAVRPHGTPRSQSPLTQLKGRTHARLATYLPAFFDWSSCQAHPVYLYSLLSTVTPQCVDCNSASSRKLQASFKPPDYKSLVTGYFSSLHALAPKLPSITLYFLQ